MTVLSVAFVLLGACRVGAHPPDNGKPHDDEAAHHHPHDGDPHAGGPKALFTTRGKSRTLPPVKETDSFHFVIFGDRTGGVPAGLKILEQAIADTNLLDPDLVMTVGDLIQGYNQTPEWMRQMKEYRTIMDQLSMPWFPVAGNHDIYWRGPGAAPQGHHEKNYEEHFGPLWYSFRHKNAGFVVLYSDEGDPDTNKKDFNNGLLQRVSDAQMKFLDGALKKLADADHVFVFLHHPRWIQPRYEGSRWDDVHQRLVKAGNVHAVFAGHIHQMHFGGNRDGIEYYALGATGGHLSAEIPGAGYLHHMNMVTVRPEGIEVASIPIGAVMDPKKFTQEFLDHIDRARQVRQKIQPGSALTISSDGSISGKASFSLTNDSDFPLSVHLDLDADRGWMTPVDHRHFDVKVGETIETVLPLVHSGQGDWRIPELQTRISVNAEDGLIELPMLRDPLPIKLNQVPADYFRIGTNHALKIRDEQSAIAIPSRQLKVPDGPMTLETWLRPDVTTGNRGIVAKTESSEFALFFDEGVPQFDIHLDGKYRTVKGNQKLPTDRWSHIAGVYDGKQVRLYVDGKRVDTLAISGSRRTNGLPLWIGADPNSRGQAVRPFLGELDEVRLSRTSRYSGESFEAARRFRPDEDTALLMHFDRVLGPFHLDHSAGAIMAAGGRSSELVPIEQ